MWIIITLLIIAIAILLIDLSYKNYCIEDLEISKSRLRRMQVEENLLLLTELKGYMNDDYERASRDTLMRNAINENIAKYSEQKRRLDRVSDRF